MPVAVTIYTAVDDTRIESGGRAEDRKGKIEGKIVGKDRKKGSKNKEAKNRRRKKEKT